VRNRPKKEKRKEKILKIRANGRETVILIMRVLLEKNTIEKPNPRQNHHPQKNPPEKKSPVRKSPRKRVSRSPKNQKETEKVEKIKKLFRKCGLSLAGITKEMSSEKALRKLRKVIEVNSEDGLKEKMTEKEIASFRSKRKRDTELADLHPENNLVDKKKTKKGNFEKEDKLLSAIPQDRLQGSG